MHQGEGGATIQTVQSLGDVNGHENMTVDLTEATVAQDGQIYITAEDGQGKFIKGERIYIIKLLKR